MVEIEKLVNGLVFRKILLMPDKNVLLFFNSASNMHDPPTIIWFCYFSFEPFVIFLGFIIELKKNLLLNDNMMTHLFVDFFLLNYHYAAEEIRGKSRNHERRFFITN